MVDVVWKLECTDDARKFLASYNKVFSSKEQAERVKTILTEAMPLMELSNSGFGNSKWHVVEVEVYEGQEDVVALYHAVLTLVYGEHFRSSVDFDIVPVSDSKLYDTVELDKLTWTVNIYRDSEKELTDTLTAMSDYWDANKTEFRHDFSLLNLRVD